MMMFISMLAKGSSSEGRRRIHIHIGRHSAYHVPPLAPYGFNSLQTHQHYK